MHMVDPAFADEHKARLTSAGIDAHGCEACGQLEVVPWQSAYLDENDMFDKDRMLAVVDQLTGSGRDAGFTRLRIMGNTDWALRGVPGSEKLLEYEAEVNDVLSRNRQPAVRDLPASAEAALADRH